MTDYISNSEFLDDEERVEQEMIELHKKLHICFSSFSPDCPGCDMKRECMGFTSELAKLRTRIAEMELDFRCCDDERTMFRNAFYKTATQDEVDEMELHLRLIKNAHEDLEDEMKKKDTKIANLEQYIHHLNEHIEVLKERIATLAEAVKK